MMNNQYSPPVAGQIDSYYRNLATQTNCMINLTDQQTHYLTLVGSKSTAEHLLLSKISTIINLLAANTNKKKCQLIKQANSTKKANKKKREMLQTTLLGNLYH